MSIYAVKWAYAQPVSPTGRKFVLVAVAEFADSEGRAFPGTDTLAAMTGQDERTVRRHLEALEKDGYLTRTERRRKDGTRSSDDLHLLAPEEALRPHHVSSGQNARKSKVRPSTGHSVQDQPDNLSTSTGHSVPTNRAFCTNQPGILYIHEGSQAALGAGNLAPNHQYEPSVEPSVVEEENTAAAAPQIQKVQTPQNSQAPAIPSQGPEVKPASAGLTTNAVQEIPGGAGSDGVDPETTVQLNKLFGTMLQDMLDDPAALVDRTDWFKIPLSRFQELLQEVRRTCRAANGGKNPRTEMKFVLDAEVGKLTPIPSTRSSYRAADDDFSL